MHRFPIPILDVYAKAGVAVYQTSVDAGWRFRLLVASQCAAYPQRVIDRSNDARFDTELASSQVIGIGIRLKYEPISCEWRAT